jgi:hypothetical protein
LEIYAESIILPQSNFVVHPMLERDQFISTSEVTPQVRKSAGPAAILGRVLDPCPNVQATVRNAYHRLKFAVSTQRRVHRVTDHRVTCCSAWEWAGVPAEDGELFFGYYDKSPWRRMQDQLLLHLVSRHNPVAAIRLFDRERACCRTVASSRAWNYQQGSMAQWLGSSSHEQVIFNDYDVTNRNLVARVVTADGVEQHRIGYPIQCVHPDGRRALTLNYARLLRLRPGYGYKLSVGNFSPDQPLDRDGIWEIDLDSGKSELVITLSQLAALEPRPGMSSQRSKINHIVPDPSGQRFVFMHRWFDDREKFSRLYVMDWGGGNCRLLLDCDLISHYHWVSPERLIVFGRPPEGHETYFLLNVTTGSIEPLDHEILKRMDDGHPSASPDGRWILTDTLPGNRFAQQLLLFDLGVSELHVLGTFVHAPKFTAATRCDLHPRWSPDGHLVSFDSVCSGVRQSYVMDVSQIVQTPDPVTPLSASETVSQAAAPR